MGNFLQTITGKYNQENLKQNSLLNLSISKLKQYHSQFKFICENFCIDQNEFKQIFEEEDKNYTIWSKNLALVDSLELFSGLCLFADAQFDEKAKFLFDLFDLNNLHTLSLWDLELMIISACNGTYKILECAENIANNEELSQYIEQFFNIEQRINLSSFINFCQTNQDIHNFCDLIQRQPPSKQKLLQKNINEKTRTKIYEHDLNNYFKRNIFIQDQNVNISQLQNDWIQSVNKQIYFTQEKYTSHNTYTDDVIVTLNWAYGIRCNDVKRCMLLISPENGDGYSEKVVYFTGCVGIVYTPKINQQQHYLQHQQEIISICSTQINSIIASGDLGLYPEIHLWNAISLEKIKSTRINIQKAGVHLLQFFGNQYQYLSACIFSLYPNSVILIYNVSSLEIFKTVNVNGITIECLRIQNFIGKFSTNQLALKPSKESIQFMKNKQHEIIEKCNSSDLIVVMTYTQLIAFGLSKSKQIIIHENNLMNYNISSKITCGILLRYNTKEPYLRAYAEPQDQSTIALSGHRNGQVIIWENFDYGGILTKYESEILLISGCSVGVVIAVNNGKLYFWNLEYTQQVRIIDLTQFQFKLYSLEIVDILISEQKTIIITNEGDVVEIYASPYIQWNSNFIKPLKSQRCNYIKQIKGEMTSATIIEKDKEERLIYIGGKDRCIYVFEVQTHELIDIWRVNDPISSMHTLNYEDGGNCFAIGCEGGKILVRIDWEEEPRQFITSNTITDIKFSSDGVYLVAASEIGQVYVFVLHNNSYFSLAPKKLQFTSELPVSITFCQENKSFLIGTSYNNIYQVELPDIKVFNVFDKENADLLNIDSWELTYLPNPKFFKLNNLMPVVLQGGYSKLIFSAQQDNICHYWKDYEQLENNCGGKLIGHSSNIRKILISNRRDLVFTLGSTDNSLFEWKIENIFFSQELISSKERKAVKRINNNQNLNQQQQQKELISENDKQEEIMDLGKGVNMLTSYDEPLYRELNYSFFINNLSNKLKDSFISHLGIQKNLFQLLYNSQQQENLQEEFLKYRPPPISLQLKHCFGFQSFDKRNTLHYVQYKNNIYFAYYVSRLIIYQDSKTKKQSFYEGHKFKITYIISHPTLPIIASGEASRLPQIHISEVVTGRYISIQNTLHQNGILYLNFSPNGEFLISVGIDRYFSIQITSWKNNEIITFKNTSSFPLFSCQISPLQHFNETEIITCGYQNITFWKLIGKQLVRKNIIKIQLENENENLKPYIIVCCAYLIYQVNEEQNCDILCGSNMGDIGIITKGKYIQIVKQAHQDIINCIKILEMNKEPLIITSGEDQKVQLWNIQFNLLFCLEINNNISELSDEVLGQGTNRSIQSLDFRIQNESEFQLLMGTRCGNIIEAIFSISSNNKAEANENLSEKSIQSDEQQDKSEDNGLSSIQQINKSQFQNEIFLKHYQFFITGHSSQLINPNSNSTFDYKKVFISLHPKLLIMASTGEDCVLRLIDTRSNTIIKQAILAVVPSAIEFNSDGDILALGFIDGMVLFFDSRITDSAQYDNYQAPSLDPLMQIPKKETLIPIIQIKFSASPEGVLAISYGHSRVIKDIFENALEKEGSHISIYIHKNSPKIQQQQKDLYIYCFDIRQPSLSDNFATQSAQFGKASQFLEFSKDENYLLIYYQLLNSSQLRVNNDPNGIYVIWEIKTDSQFNNLEKAKEIQWHVLNFPNSIHCQYSYLENLLLGKEKIEQIGPLAIASAMQAELDYILIGTQNGEILICNPHILQTCYYELEQYKEKQLYFLSKQFESHSSFVSQLCLFNLQAKSNERLLYSVGALDECILQWVVKIEPNHWDLDCLQHNISEFNVDIFNEIPPKPKFKNELNNLNALRQQALENRLNVDSINQPKHELILENIIGRTAFQQRNNLLYDQFGRIISIAGANIVITDSQSQFKSNRRYGYLNDPKFVESDDHLYQEFLLLDDVKDPSCCPQIKQIALSPCKKIFCASTFESQSKLLIWELNSKTLIKSLTIHQLVVTNRIQFAYNSRHIVCMGLTKHYKNMLILIDSFQNLIICACTFEYSLPFKIMSIQFYPNQFMKILLSGIQHIQCWEVKGQTFAYHSFQLDYHYVQENEQLTGEKEKQQKKDKLQITLLCSIFPDNNNSDEVVAGADDGNLYLWVNEIIKCKQFIDSPITTLCNNGLINKIFISGNMQGQIDGWILHKLEETDQIEFQNLFSFKIFYGENNPISIEERIQNLDYNIQSLCLGQKNQLLVGTKSGNAIEITNLSFNLNKKKNEIQKVILSAHDHDIPIMASISQNSEQIFSITKYGIFSVWNLRNLKLLYRKDFNRFTTDLILYILSKKILIVFEKEAIMLCCKNFQIKSTYELVFKNIISTIKLSRNEKILAVSLQQLGDELPWIEVFDTDNDQNSFKQLCKVENLSSDIEMLDFSTDNQYLLFKNKYEEVGVLNLTTLQSTNTIFVDFSTEWMSNGLLIHSYTQGVQSYYLLNSNQITQMKKIANDTLVVSDIIGTIKLFNYPCKANSVVGYTRCYSNHLCYINTLIISYDQNYLISICSIDRCIFLWRIKQIPQKNYFEENEYFDHQYE